MVYTISIHFSFDDEKGLFSFGVALSGKLRNVRFAINVRDDDYIVYATSPVRPDHKDDEMMAAMAELVCRMNFGIVNGNFELDFTDGELRYKSFVDCDGGLVPTREIVKNSIIITASMLDRYSPCILAILFEDASVKDAYEKRLSAADLLSRARSRHPTASSDKASPSDEMREDLI